MTVHSWLRYSVFRRLLLNDVRSVLEIGAGKGSVGSLLARRYRYVGLEPDAVSYATAARRIGSLGTVFQTNEESFSSEELFDAVCAFEVLEHIEDDRAALVRWQRHVKPGGFLFVSVPARPHRFGPSDVRQGHFRRYDRDGLARLLTATGLSDVTVVTYGFPIGYALHAYSHALARRRPYATALEERTAASARWMQPSEHAATVMRAVAAPFALLQRPFGATALGTGLVARGRLMPQ